MPHKRNEAVQAESNVDGSIKPAAGASSAMRVAVITATYPRRLDWLAQCHASVKAQTHPCTHILVADGGEPHGLKDFEGQFIALTHRHKDWGDTPRTVGAYSAWAQGFDAVCWLDDDNWFEPDHVKLMVQAHQKTGAVVCSSGRWLVDLNNDERLGLCSQNDGKSHVDANCFFITRHVADLAGTWATMPTEFHKVCDVYFLYEIRRRNLRHAHLNIPTVNYRTNWAFMYRMFGKEVPPNARYDEGLDAAIAKIRAL